MLNHHEIMMEQNKLLNYLQSFDYTLNYRLHYLKIPINIVTLPDVHQVIITQPIVMHPAELRVVNLYTICCNMIKRINLIINYIN